MDSIDISKVNVVSAYDVSRQKLLDYYHELYPNRRGILAANWEWQNRSKFLDKRVPLVLEYNGEILGHLGSMPFEIELNGKKYTAQWLIDFSIAEPYRRLGLGNIITQKWMELCEINLTCCNSKAIKIFKKFGWTQNEHSYLHFLFINPFGYPKLSKKIGARLAGFLGFLVKPIIMGHYRFKAYPKEFWKIEQLDEQNIRVFEHSQISGENILTTFRDYSYLKWRFLDSFDRDSYFIFSIKDFNQKFLIKLQQKDVSYIQILMQTEPVSNEELVKSLASISLWAGLNNYNHVMYYSSIEERNRLIKKRLKSYAIYQIYAYHSANKSLSEVLDKSIHYWDLCDSDFEHYNLPRAK